MFEKVIGHEQSKELLIKDLNNKTVSHAYLFTGPEGIGKKELATRFAEQLLGTNKLDVCVDYKYIEKLPDKKDIIVEQIREKIVNDVYIAPATCDYKVYIINDAHLMNDAAQNALLKTLEEPPAYVVIILITHKEELMLTTVMSRVHIIRFGRLNENELACYFKMNNKELSSAQLAYADGSIKIGLELIQDNQEKYNNIEKVFAKLKAKDILETMKYMKELDFKDDETFNYLENIMLTNKCYSWVSLVENARNRMAQSGNEEFVKHALIIKLLQKEE